MLLDHQYDSPATPCRAIPPTPEKVNLEEALQSLSTSLEDYQGKHPELQKLEQMVNRLDRLLKVTI